MRIAFGHMRTTEDVVRALQGLERDLGAELHWCGLVVADPDPVSPGDLWLRTDLLELRLRTKDADGVLATYSVAVTKVEEV